jgi:copper chaperone NosL
VKTTRAAGALALLAATVLAAACGSASVPAPRAIAVGKDVCVKCRQVIASTDAAAEVVLVDGTYRVYDDLGCLATDAAALRGGGQFYVQFAGGKGWMRVEDVHFAHQPDRPSPRGFNYFAYTEDDARRLDVDHWARGWDDVVAELSRTK